MAMTVDKISELPDSILHSILSSMPVKYAIRTGVLSTRWIDIWTRLPYLNFDETEFRGYRSYRRLPVMRAIHIERKERMKFVNFVHAALFCYQSTNITTFRLRLSYDGRFHIFLTQWVFFAIIRSVREIDLDFSGGGYAGMPGSGCQPFELPLFLFGYDLLRVLKLNYCIFNPSGFRVFMSLQALSLSRIDMSSELLMIMLENCLVLKMLELVKCNGLFSIMISSTTLESLSVRDCKPLCAGISIQTPNLQSFDYFGHMVSFQTGKMVSLVDVVLDFGLQFVFVRCGKQLSDLLGDFDQAVRLTLCPYLIQVLPTAEEHFLTSLPKTLQNLKNLTLHTGMEDTELPGIACLLNSCPNLESLTLELGLAKSIKGYNYNEFLKASSFDPREYWESHYFNCVSDHLKFVYLNGFTGWENEMELVKYLLKNAMVLKKMTVVVPKERYLRLDRGYEKRRAKLAREMRGFVAASPVAQIKFY